MSRKQLTMFAIVAIATVLSSAAGHAADGAFSEMNLPWGTEVPPSDHEFTPGPEALFTFPSDDSIVVGSGGFIDSTQVGFFWSADRGDSVSETFTGPPVATSYTLDVDVITNTLVSVGTNWQVLINGVEVDLFPVSPGFVGTVSRTAMFPDIPGPTYTVELRLVNEIPPGGGSHTFRYAGFGLNQIDISEGAVGTVICLDSFCDTFDCGIDNGNIVTCSWNYNCSGTDNEQLIGGKFGPDIAVGGEINGQGTTWGWTIDVPNSTMSLYRWDGVGQSFLQTTDTFTLNSCDFARSGASVLESIQ